MMPALRRKTAEARIRAYFAGMSDVSYVHGLDLMAATKCGSGLLYPVLAKLEAEGTIQGDFVGRTYPRRRIYWPADTETPSISKLPGKAVNMLISDELAQQMRTRPDWIGEALE